MHPKKAYFSIEVNDEGNVICVNDEQFSNALFSIKDTVWGSKICVKDIHFENDFEQIVFIEGGTAILFSFSFAIKFSFLISSSCDNK